MILDISDSIFRNLMSDKFLGLPRRWDGLDYHLTVNDLFEKYKRKVSPLLTSTGDMGVKGIIDDICNLILESIKYYLNGYPEGCVQRGLQFRIGNLETKLLTA